MDELLETETKCSRCRKTKSVDQFGYKPDCGGLYKICIKCREYSIELYSSKKVIVSDTNTGQIVHLPISELIGSDELLEHSWTFLSSCLDSMAKKGWVFSHPGSGFEARYRDIPEDTDGSIEIEPFLPPSTIIPVTRKTPQQIMPERTLKQVDAQTGGMLKHSVNQKDLVDTNAKTGARLKPSVRRHT
jgi:hypothetical protein